MKTEIRWVSAHKWIEAQTARMARELKSSRPKPSNRRMGFKGEDKPRRLYPTLER